MLLSSCLFPQLVRLPACFMLFSLSLEPPFIHSSGFGTLCPSAVNQLSFLPSLKTFLYFPSSLLFVFSLLRGIPPPVTRRRWVRGPRASSC